MLHENIAVAKEILTIANLLVFILVIPLYKFIKSSIGTNIELANTIKELKEELSLLRNILFDVADGDTIKKHLSGKKK